MRRFRLPIGVLLALLCAPLQADDRWALCPAWEGPTLPRGPDAGRPSADAPLHIEADVLDTERVGESLFTGRVLLHHGDRSLGADSVRHERAENIIQGTGEIRYTDGEMEIAGHGALLDLDDDRVRFDDVEFRLFERRARGSAGSLQAARGEPVVIQDARFTTCPVDDQAWMLRAPRVDLDTEAGIGTGRHVRVDFKGLPVFYTPWISFPLTDDRKTGFLVPDVGSARNTGVDIRVPWYWNIAPNRDATITPRYMGERGLQLGTEFRYLYPNYHGEFEADVLPDDRRHDNTRTRAAWRHQAQFAPGWQFHSDVNHVSDADYFEDLAGGLERPVVTHLLRRAELSYYGDWQSLVMRVDGWQTLDIDIPHADHPYSRLPQMLWHARWPTADGGPQFMLDSEAVHFYADDDVRMNGTRVDIAPSATWLLDGAAWHVVPRAAWRQTHYQLEAPAADATRGLPIFSVDAGLTFERPLGHERLQTLEPRLYWLRIPHRDQDALPLFDTSRPDFNLVQLYSDNRFNGADRVGDTHHVALGLGSRTYSTATGDSLMAWQVGRIRYFDDRRVTLPGDAPETGDWSDYLGEASINWNPSWSTRLGAQYDPDAERVERSLVQLRYHPGRDRLLNLGWRFRRGQIDQTDLSFAWPVDDRWSVVGRWNWSVDERRNIETFFGVEYQSCCWALRVVSREYVANRAGDTNRSIYVQLELKGLANVGRGTEALLERGILGYSARR